MKNLLKILLIINLTISNMLGFCTSGLYETLFTYDHFPNFFKGGWIVGTMISAGSFIWGLQIVLFIMFVVWLVLTLRKGMNK